MTRLGILIAALAFFALPLRADQVDYTLSVENAPGGIGNFSWTITQPSFIELTPPLFNSMGECTNCNRYNFNSFVSVEAPTKGEGCGISGVFMDPQYALTTFFSPLCDGKFDSTTAGGFPDPPNQFGTLIFQGINPDDTLNLVTFTISPGPVSTPEPGTLGMLFLGLGGWWPLLGYGCAAPRRNTSPKSHIQEPRTLPKYYFKAPVIHLIGTVSLETRI